MQSNTSSLDLDRRAAAPILAIHSCWSYSPCAFLLMKIPSFPLSTLSRYLCSSSLTVSPAPRLSRPPLSFRNPTLENPFSPRPPLFPEAPANYPCSFNPWILPPTQFIFSPAFALSRSTRHLLLLELVLFEHLCFIFSPPLNFQVSRRKIFHLSPPRFGPPLVFTSPTRCRDHTVPGAQVPEACAMGLPPYLGF